MSKEQSLFGDFTDPKAPKVLCRDVTGTTVLRPGYDGRWWEYQANRAIGAFLLPRPLVYIAIESLVVKRGALGTSVLESDRRGEAIALLTETFDVNPIVAKIRLEDVYPAANEDQLTL